MIWTVPSFVLFFLIIAIYIFRPSWLLLFWLITTPILAPFMVAYSGIGNFLEQQSYVWGIWGIFNRAYILIIVFELIRGSKLSGSLRRLIVPGIILSFYFLIHNFITHPDIMTFIGHNVDLVYTVVPMIALMLNKKLWPSLTGYYWVIFFVYIIELLWLPLNAQGIFAYPARYQEVLTQELTLSCGTFTRSNKLADYVALTFFFITLDYFYRKSLSWRKYIAILVMAFLLLMATGSKLPIAVTAISIIVCVLMFKREKISVVASSIVASAMILFFLSTTRLELNSSNEGLNRIVEGLGSFTQSKINNRVDESTFGISEELLDRYFNQSPLFGNGFSYKGEETAYIVSRSGIDLTGLKTDATIAFYLVEYGLLGTLLYLIFYYNVIKCACSLVRKKRNLVTFSVLSFYLLFSVTEGGLFLKALYTYAYLYLFGLNRLYNEEKREVVS